MLLWLTIKKKTMQKGDTLKTKNHVKPFFLSFFHFQD